MSDFRRAATSRGLVFVLGCAVLLSVSPVRAGQRYAQRWEEMSPQERGEAYRNYQRFQRMPPDQRRQVERNYDRWQQMPPQEKERMRSNYREYRKMPREERRQLDRRQQRGKGRD